MASPVQQIIEPQQLLDAASQLYVSTDVWTQIQALNCANTDTGTRVITIYIVPFGTSPATSNITTPPLSILAGGNYNGRNEYGMVMNPGDSLWAFADVGAKVNIFASGLLLTG